MSSAEPEYGTGGSDHMIPAGLNPHGHSGGWPLLNVAPSNWASRLNVASSNQATRERGNKFLDRRFVVPVGGSSVALLPDGL